MELANEDEGGTGLECTTARRQCTRAVQRVHEEKSNGQGMWSGAVQDLNQDQGRGCRSVGGRGRPWAAVGRGPADANSRMSRKTGKQVEAGSVSGWCVGGPTRHS